MSGEVRGVPEGWREVKLGDVLQVLKDGTHFSPQEFLDEGRKYITSKNIRFGYMDLSDIQYVSEEVHAKIYKGSPVKKGDVLLTKDGANTGNVAINNLEEEFSLLSSVAILRGRGDSLQNEYLFQHLMSPKTQNFIQGDMAGQAITRLTLQKIGRFPLLLPPLPEQRKIAAILSTWDDSLATLTNLLAAKRRQKRGLAEALLTGKKRLPGFEGEWEEKKLGEIIEITSSKRIFEEQWRSSGIPFYRARDLVRRLKGDHGEESIFIDPELYKEIKEKYGVPRVGDILVTAVGTLGIAMIVRSDSPFYFKDGNIIWLKMSSKISSDFLYQAFLSTSIKKQIEAFSGGSTVGTYTITNANNTKLLVPPLSEQQAIASILSTLDGEIASLEALRSAVQEQKRGLMDELLTGRVRVKVTEE